jgi:hypothetical protein
VHNYGVQTGVARQHFPRTAGSWVARHDAGYVFLEATEHGVSQIGKKRILGDLRKPDANTP